MYISYSCLLVLLQNTLNCVSEFSESQLAKGWTPDELIPQGYLRTQPPSGNGTPVTVEMSLTVNQIIAINEVEQSFTIEASLEQLWSDERLNFPTGFDYITLDGSWKNKIWVPDTFFMNLLQGTTSSAETVPTYLYLSNTSRVVIVSRRIVKLSCSMDLFLFPQDTQICPIEMSSVIYSKQKVNYAWSHFDVALTAQYSKFELPMHYNGSCISLRGPDFPCLRAEIKFYRRLSYYCIRIYAPSFLLVITSFVGFWVPVLGYPARGTLFKVALVVTPLLSLITQQTQINAEINVSYVVALHIWMMFCIFFVFMALIEYALTIVYCHSIDEKKERLNRNSIGVIRSNEGSKASHWIKKCLLRIYGYIDWYKAPLDRNKVDYCARIIFPASYILFVLIYIFVFVIPWIVSKYNIMDIKP